MATQKTNETLVFIGHVIGYIIVGAFGIGAIGLLLIVLRWFVGLL